MATKYTCPPQSPSGFGTFSDNLVGFQLTDGGGLTQGNFNFTTGVTEKSNRNFETGVFGQPINLETLNISVEESKNIQSNITGVYPNFDLSFISNFTLFGPLSERFSASITKIINFFPASLDIKFRRPNFTTGYTAFDVNYNSDENETEFSIYVSAITNPFGIDFTTNSAKNIAKSELPLSKLRDITTNFRSYTLILSSTSYNLKYFYPSATLTGGTISLVVNGNPFSAGTATTTSYDSFIVRPNNIEVEQVFDFDFDQVDNFLLNRSVSPIYTAIFKVPRVSDDGIYYNSNENTTWPLDGEWNLDIRTPLFDNYVSKLNEIAENFDSFKTNLISRFLTTNSFIEFDTFDRKIDKVLKIYGRSFDETKKYIDALSHMTSVNYIVKDDIPSQLLTNLAETIGWNSSVSPISQKGVNSTVYNESLGSEFEGISVGMTQDELNYQYYRNLILNSAYLFKSKGTRKSIDFLLKLIGAPEALIEFNESVYVVSNKINVSDLDSQFSLIGGGEFVETVPVLDTNSIYSFNGESVTGFTSETRSTTVTITREDYPVDSEGYPSPPTNTDGFFFQKGAGWYQLTPDHQSNLKVDTTLSVFTGSNPDIQTSFSDFTYGKEYVDRFRDFPYTNLGYSLTRVTDNNKSWGDNEIPYRSNEDASYYAFYSVSDERLVINAKNTEIFLNPAQALAYDVWYLSQQYDYPIPNSGLSNPYPQTGGIDSTVINPKPRTQPFFEFYQSFWRNMINVRNRQISTDGKTGGYPTLQYLWYSYLTMYQDTGIQNDNFSYQKMIEYISGIGGYWLNLVDQFVPATTLWNGGTKLENSIFNRQKFLYRRNRKYQLPTQAVPGSPTVAPLGDYGCLEETVVLGYGIITAPILSQAITDYQLSNPSTSLNTVSTYWKLKLTLDGVTITSPTNFFVGNGTNGGEGESFPSDSVVDAAVNTFFTSSSVITALSTKFYSATPDTANNKIYLTTTNCQQADLQEANLGIDLLISALSTNTIDASVYWIKLVFGLPTNLSQQITLIFKRTSLTTVGTNVNAFNYVSIAGTGGGPTYTSIVDTDKTLIKDTTRWKVKTPMYAVFTAGNNGGNRIYFSVQKNDLTTTNYPNNLGWGLTSTAAPSGINPATGLVWPAANPSLVGLTSDVDIFYSTDFHTTNVNNVNWNPNPSNIII